MSFPDLTSHIQQTFSAFSGSDEYEAQLSLWCQRRGAVARARTVTTAAWRERRPAAAASSVARWQQANRPALRRADAKWRAKLPADECWCGAKKAKGRSLCEPHLEANRIRAREYARKAKAA